MTNTVATGQLRPISKVLRLHGAIARELGIAITSGKYRPGDMLVGEVASSEKLSVSRAAYREAVRILAAKGLVESRPKVGTKVSPRTQWHMLDPDVLAWAFEGEPDLDLLASLYELRDIVESEAAALASQRRTIEHLDAMHNGIERMAHHTLETDAGRQGDMDFHAALLEATGNPYIISLTNGVNAAVKTTTLFKLRAKSLTRDVVPDHQRVFQAIADHDADGARKAMSELINLALEDVQLPWRRLRAGACPE